MERKRNIYIENMPLEQALELFWRRIEACGWFELISETISVFESLGRMTASPVYARRSSPHYVASAMDGIAVKAETTYGASETNPITLAIGQFKEMDTGDYVPVEYDAVIMIEDVNHEEQGVKIIKAAVPWQHIRSVGEDLVEEDMIVPSLTPIGPYELASFITAGITTIPVIKRPVVGIIPTGTELVPHAIDDMAPGLIVESNSHMLSGLCKEWGAVPLRHSIVVDDKQLIKNAVKEMKEQVDLIVVCSGSSAGTEDYTSSIVEELGERIVHGIATRPGKPAILGIIDNKPVIGVPGYPISAQLIFTLFAKPILYKKLGQALPEPLTMNCTLSKKLPSHMGVDEYAHVNIASIEDRFVAYPLNRGAGLSSILVKSDGYLHIERGNEGLNAGETCQVFLQRPPELIKNTMVCIGSHDMTIDYLSDLLRKKWGQRLISSNVGSMGGIMALKKRETHLAGVHLLDYASGEYNIPYLEKYLPHDKWMLINLVKRHQGLIVKKGNPLHIQSIDDLVQKDIRFMNRQKGAGTRVLLDYLMQKKGITPKQINGYNREEYTHLAVATSVKNDACDTGLAIYAAAKIIDLDFVPIDIERYDLCILPDLISSRSLENLLAVIHSQAFKQLVLAAGGYDLDLSGQILCRHNC